MSKGRKRLHELPEKVRQKRKKDKFNLTGYRFINIEILANLIANILFIYLFIMAARKVQGQV